MCVLSHLELANQPRLAQRQAATPSGHQRCLKDQHNDVALRVPVQAEGPGRGQLRPPGRATEYTFLEAVAFAPAHHVTRVACAG